jgi:hypothetical protein
MTCPAIPISQVPYRRYANLTPNDTTVFDPPTDAILLPVILGSNTVQVYLVGSDDALVGLQFGAAQSGAIIPLSTKKFTTDNTAAITGLWHD